MPRVAAAVPLPVPPAPRAICSASVSPVLSSIEIGLQRRQRRRDREYLGSARPSRFVAGQPPRPPDVPLPGLRGPRCRLGIDAAAPQYVGDRLGRGDAQRHQPAARADGHGHVVGMRGRCAQQEDRARRRLLDGLEQRVGRGLGEAVGVLDHDDLPAAERGQPRRRGDDGAHLGNRDRQPLRDDGVDVRMAAAQCGVAARAFATARLAVADALQRRRERARRDRPARARGPGEQPGVRHGAGRGVAPCVDFASGPRGRAQHLDRGVLAHEVVPYRRFWPFGGPWALRTAKTVGRTHERSAFGCCSALRRPSSSRSTSTRTRAASSSGEREPSRTR